MRGRERNACIQYLFLSNMCRCLCLCLCQNCNKWWILKSIEIRAPHGCTGCCCCYWWCYIYQLQLFPLWARMFEIILFNKFLVSIVFVCSTSSFSHSAWFDSVLVWLSVATASTMCFLLFIDLFPIKHTHTHTERDYYCCCGCCFFLHPFHAGLLLKNILREWDRERESIFLELNFFCDFHLGILTNLFP